MTHIEWTDETWNPIVGCSKVSAGCKNCYAMHMAARLEAMGVPQYQGLTTKQHGKTNWTGKLRFVESALEKPLHWKKPRRIFVNSMSDLFHPDVQETWIEEVWAIMAKTPQHQYQILTKHPDKMFEDTENMLDYLDNIILGTSVENSAAINRISWLDNLSYDYKTFVSFEPLIGSVKGVDLCGIDWAIVGGESGKGARPMNPEWVQEIYDACQKSGTKFFFKQWGAYGEDGVKRSKKANGRLWQGQTWDGMPDHFVNVNKNNLPINH